MFKTITTAAPELPTGNEAGVKGFAVTSWPACLLLPAHPKTSSHALIQGTQEAIKSPAVKSALESHGAEPGGNSSAEFARFMADELKSWGEVVRTSGAKVD